MNRATRRAEALERYGIRKRSSRTAAARTTRTCTKMVKSSTRCWRRTASKSASSARARTATSSANASDVPGPFAPASTSVRPARTPSWTSAASVQRRAATSSTGEGNSSSNRTKSKPRPYPSRVELIKFRASFFKSVNARFFV